MSFIETFASTVLSDLSNRLRDAKNAHFSLPVSELSSSQVAIRVLEQAISVVAHHAIKEVGTSFLLPLGMHIEDNRLTQNSEPVVIKPLDPSDSDLKAAE